MLPTGLPDKAPFQIGELQLGVGQHSMLSLEEIPWRSALLSAGLLLVGAFVLAAF